MTSEVQGPSVLQMSSGSTWEMVRGGLHCFYEPKVPDKLPQIVAILPEF